MFIHSSVGDNLSGNLLKASEIVDKISDVHAKIKKKNEDDHLMLRCNLLVKCYHLIKILKY